MQSVPSAFNLFGLNQLDLRAQAVGVSKLNHLAGIGDTPDQLALEAAITKYDQCGKDLQLLCGNPNQTELAATT